MADVFETSPAWESRGVAFQTVLKHNYYKYASNDGNVSCFPLTLQAAKLPHKLSLPSPG